MLLLDADVSYDSEKLCSDGFCVFRICVLSFLSLDRQSAGHKISTPHIFHAF